MAAGLRYSPRWGATGSWGGHPSVLFDIRDQAGNLVAVHGRSVECDAKITYGSKSLGVFFSPGSEDAEIVVVTEAPIDALSLTLVGLSAIALIGTSWPVWLRHWASRKTVLIALDSDEQGEEVSLKLGRDLSWLTGRCFRLRPAGFKDWNELMMSKGEDHLYDLLDQALARV